MPFSHRRTHDSVTRTDCCVLFAVAASMSEADLSNSVKNGIMYLEDPVDNEWLPHYFVLTQSKLLYTEETNMSGAQDDDDDDDTMPVIVEVRICSNRWWLDSSQR